MLARIRASPVRRHLAASRCHGGISGSPGNAVPFAIPSAKRNLSMRMQTFFDSWDCTLPALPKRSRLYALKPLGIGTPFVESLSGYVARLADAHAVSLGNFVGRELSALAANPLVHSFRAEIGLDPHGFHARPYAINS